jgi:hypothetical protein
MKEIKNYKIEVDSVRSMDDYEAFFTYAEHMDGIPLTEQELEALDHSHGHLLYEAAYESALATADFRDYGD